MPEIACADAVAACGVVVERRGGKLPPHVTAYLTMALILFPGDDYEVFATKGTGSLARRLYSRRRADELLTADRNFYSFEAWACPWCGSWRTARSCPCYERRNVPRVDGARTPSNSRRIPP